ncbi:MAG: glycoside hydrolase family 3 protein [Clostridia bacterium]|nr:glycoside hydrolase family 3 protein [Clostridia bacterium]
MNKIDELVEKMTLDELCGQTLCYFVPGAEIDENFEKIVKETKPGGIFISNACADKIKLVTDKVNKYVSIPVIVSADVEKGPGGDVLTDGYPLLPNPIAWGAADDEKLIEKSGEITAKICKKAGIHWTYSPVVDINYNHNNPVVNVRAVSDSSDHVIKIAGAYMRGLQKNNYMAACCKHFPGDGLDDRNQHFCTTLNTFSKEEWMNSYGRVYKSMIDQGVASIMVAHIAAPAFQEDEYDDVTGYMPGSMSYSLITKLLREELGFKGCIVSDALSMIGVAACVPENEMIVRFINAGGDMALFAESSYFYYLKEAVLDGRVSMERLKDAVRRILRLKEFAGVFKEETETENEENLTEEFNNLAEEIALKSIKFVRNADGILPIKLERGDTVLICNLTQHNEGSHITHLDIIEKELNSRGIKTISENKIGHKEIKRIYDEHNPKCVLVNIRMSSDECDGNDIRMSWSHMMCFWRGYIFKNPNVIVTSFGDPYKIYELPFLRTYINAFSAVEASQKAFVKVLLGEVKEQGKNPVKLEGFFEREV